jgi:hypothetical protein
MLQEKTKPLTTEQRTEHEKTERSWTAVNVRAECILRGLPPDYAGRAAQSTLDAVVFELREYGVAQLDNAQTKARLAQLSEAQTKELIERLSKLASLYPAISGELLDNLKELIP